ncbi:cytochrome c biogenesis protein CcsA [bacterium]|nr:cytochrome c biogenesis protein CcsA [bacterium]
MSRPDAILFTIAFAAYLASFVSFILLVALKKESMGKIGVILTIIGLLPHTGAFVMRWTAQGHFPLANMYEYMGMMAWMVMLGLLFFIKRFKNQKIGVFIAPIAVMLLVTASLLPSDTNAQLMPALQSSWLVIHVTLAALGSGAFMISFAASSLYLLFTQFKKKDQQEELQRAEWYYFLIFWVATPIISAVILNLIGLMPESLGGHNHNPSGVHTAFSIGIGASAKHWGGMAIGMGMGMILGAVLWPIFHNRKYNTEAGLQSGGRFFTVVVFALLFSAVIVGYMNKGGAISLTPRSYFKIFEFFGPVLVLSWVLTPLFYYLLVSMRESWIDKLQVSRPILEEISYSAVAIAYPLYTVGALFAGAVLAEQAWGTWWSWDPKEVGALIIWLFYTGFLHARFQRQWKGERAQVLVVLGMVFVFVSFFGNYFFGGLHSFEVT